MSTLQAPHPGKPDAQALTGSQPRPKRAEARASTKSMREILDERAHIYSEFCKARR
jgi:hypothetical protein